MTSDLVVGYRTYVELIRPILGEQQTVATGMGQEIDRVNLALDEAGKGKIVSLVSSGDAGIYGMAGLVLEVCRSRQIPLAPEPGGVPPLPRLALFSGRP